MLQKEFGQSVGFHNHIVFDVLKCGTYIEAAINFWGISEHDMLKNVAKIHKEK